MDETIEPTDEDVTSPEEGLVSVEEALLEELQPLSDADAERVLSSLWHILVEYPPEVLAHEFRNLDNRKLDALDEFRRRLDELLACYGRHGEIIKFDLMPLAKGPPFVEDLIGGCRVLSANLNAHLRTVRKKHGRPADVWLDRFVEKVASVYEQATGKKPGFSKPVVLVHGGIKRRTPFMRFCATAYMVATRTTKEEAGSRLDNAIERVLAGSKKSPPAS